MDDTKYWVWLMMVFGVGSRRIWDTVNIYGDAENTYTALVSGGNGFSVTQAEKRNIGNVSLEQAQEYIERCASKGIGIAGYSSREYPPQLRNVFNPPAVLHYRGNIACLTGTRTITAVGTRTPSVYGADAAYKICRQLAAEGFVIVSGFAVGTDIAAHMAAADCRRPTACVLGCGIDINYPKPNIRFYEKILESGGVFISEYPPGTEPHSTNFPKRNRILAALGRLTLVFEASIKSGSLITANMAADCGRDVFVLPPADIFGNAFSGNIALLRDGAQPLYGTSEVIECFSIGGAIDAEIRADRYSGIGGIRKSTAVYEEEDSSINIIKESGKNVRKRKKADQEDVPENNEIKKQEAEKGTSAILDDPSLSEIQRRICSVLAAGKLHIEVIAAQLEADTAELMTELTELEILGAVRQLPGKTFELC
ncbi:MAG: DNA-processing protein DprA [Ruminococcus sp.]|nr:DNA-processing protein DprA [Ruminococcus sp.]